MSGQIARKLMAVSGALDPAGEPVHGNGHGRTELSVRRGSREPSSDNTLYKYWNRPEKEQARQGLLTSTVELVRFSCSDLIIDSNYMVPYISTMKLSKKHQKILTAVFELPTRANIRWADIERLFAAVGADIAEGSGSRVRIKLGDQVKTFHRPHPGKEAKHYAVEATREFLSDHDITP